MSESSASAGASTTQSAQSNAAREVARKGAGFTRSSWQPAQSLQGAAPSEQHADAVQQAGDGDSCKRQQNGFSCGVQEQAYAHTALIGVSASQIAHSTSP